jgi:hypothetical protein
VDGFKFTDITYHRCVENGTVRIALQWHKTTNCSGSPKTRRRIQSCVSSRVKFTNRICEMFTDDLTEDRLYGIPDDGKPDRLAIARQQMAFDPLVSWELLMKFRTARSLKPSG